MKLIHPKKYKRLILTAIHSVSGYTRSKDFEVISKVAEEQLGYKCNLTNPVTFNDKINWYKLHDRNHLYPLLIDKWKVKQIVAEVIGTQYVIPTIIGGIKSPSAIPWDKLPSKFVIKCNHDSGSAVVCSDISKVDKKYICEKLSKALAISPNKTLTRARICGKITPSILIEENICPEESDLDDFKFFCFNGKVKIFKIDHGRKSGTHRANYYSVDGEAIGLEEVVCPSDFSHVDTIPDNINEMICLAERLAAFVNRAFIRVDFYNVKGQIYFGELTFYPAGGYGKFNPIEWDYTLGSWIDLSHKGRIQ